MAPVTTPGGIYTVDFDSTKTATFPSIQTWTTQLTSAVNAAGANALDDDFAWMQSLFRGVDLSRHMPIRVTVGDVGGGATWSPENINFGVIVSVSISSDPLFLRYLLVSEMVEVFMFEQGLGWFGGSTHPGSRNDNGNEGDNGEGLSRFLGRQLLLRNGSTVEAIAPRFTVGNQWLKTSGRGNFISSPDSPSNSDVNPDQNVGCTTLFINYLHTQLGFTIEQIVHAGAPNLEAVYRNLTEDDGDPFPVFAMLLASAFPPGPPGGVGAQVDNTKQPEDDPFPIALLEFIVPKSTFGRDEVADAIADPTKGGVYTDQIWVQLSGLSRNLMGPTVPTLSGSVQTFPPGNIVSFDATRGVQFERPNNVFIPQKILYPFNVSFNAASIAGFPPVALGGLGSIPDVRALTATLAEPSFGLNLTASVDITFDFGENPYFVNETDITPSTAPPTQTNLNPFYLSQDLRILTATPELDQRPVKGSAIHASPPEFPSANANVAGAYQYMQQLLKYMNTEYSDPTKVDPFSNSTNSILPNQFYIYSQDSSVAPYTYGFGTVRYQNFNFAIARVRLQSTPAVPATDVRVFFRAWTTNSADTQFDPTTTYPSVLNASSQPIFPLPASDLHTVPFFATQNKPDSGNPNNSEYGPDGVGINTHTLSGDVWKYYGCFLNLYDPALNFPRIGSHHCLVAQIAFAGTPLTVTGTHQPTPADSDKLAQRNLSITWAENPGPATKVIPQTFDLRPTKPATSEDLDPQQERPDDLLIEWGDTPQDSVCQIYWPAIAASNVIKLARKYYGTHSLSLFDANTVELKSVKGMSWIPIPSSAGESFAGLITVNLPSTIKDGQRFNIVLHRLSTHTKPKKIIPALLPSHLPKKSHIDPLPTAPGPVPAPRSPNADYWKYEVGSFAISVPVTKAEDFIHYELDALAIMKYRLSQTKTTDRWFPVLQRYVGVLSSRVDGLGGDASAVPANPRGAPVTIHFPGYGGGDDDGDSPSSSSSSDVDGRHRHHHGGAGYGAGGSPRPGRGDDRAH